MEIKINREIRNYTESMFFGLSMRQFIFAVAGCGILEAFIERIVVYKDSFDWHLRINDNSNNTIPKEYESEFEEAVSIIDAPDTIDQSEDKLLITSFVLTIEDAKKYMYSIDTKKRVHRWKNITVNLYT